MPVATSYPGVYIQEVPSSVHTVTGVPTSVAAFVGYARQGPVNESVHITSWADYVRAFGGLDPAVEMSYSVYLFFANGGSAAEIVRAGGKGGADDNGAKASFKLANDFVLEAISPGDWATNLVIEIQSGEDKVPENTFNLIIHVVADDGTINAVESYKQLSLETVGAALSRSSYFNLAPGDPPAKIPADSVYCPAEFDDVVTKAFPAPHAPPAPPPPAPPAPAPAPAPAAPKIVKDKFTPGEPTPGGDDPTKLDIAGTTPGVGVTALDDVDIFNIVCLPKPAGKDLLAEDVSAVAEYCERKRAMLLVDPPASWADAWKGGGLDFKSATGFPSSTNAAVYFPNIQTTDPATGALVERGPSGVIAGVWAATDVARGVWKAPAGTNASLSGIANLTANINDEKNGVLNPLGVNCLRTLPLAGPVIWGARTCKGADRLGSEWKYLPVRRTALFIEESLRRGTQWIVFEPNDEPLWAAIRLNVGAFMNSLYRQGAFQGSTPQEAYLVKCDKENNPHNDIDRGIVNISVGFAPLKPAEFVIIHIEQLAGQLQV
ncbi:MAG: uncharacterized protein QOH54_2533 [Mycobacterium sp.]|nr:uncharacterized protein [Mycobacterium sp.]MDT5126889.1 uncharacterized protein [Mycobacterium sp.]